jgi:hypothetical protein
MLQRPDLYSEVTTVGKKNYYHIDTLDDIELMQEKHDKTRQRVENSVINLGNRNLMSRRI